MEQGFIDIIQQLVKEQGKEILLDVKRAKPMLSDYTCNDFKKETNLFKQILEVGCAKLSMTKIML